MEITAPGGEAIAPMALAAAALGVLAPEKQAIRALTASIIAGTVGFAAVGFTVVLTGRCGFTHHKDRKCGLGKDIGVSWSKTNR